jgi:hypothetical protein
MGREPTLDSMNPLALIEATAAARTAVQGALATDPVVPNPTARRARSRAKRPSISTMLAAVQRLGGVAHVQTETVRPRKLDERRPPETPPARRVQPKPRGSFDR